MESMTSGSTIVIRKNEPRWDFEKELAKAMTQYDELLKDLMER